MITGAARGIGAAIAHRLFAAGEAIIPTARREEGLKEYREWAAREPERCLPCILDLSEPEQIDQSVEYILEHWGGLEGLVHNAGVAQSEPFLSSSVNDWSPIFEVNLLGPARLTQKLLPSLLKAEQGRVVFIASVAGLTGFAYTTPYCASKHAMVGLMRSLAAEYARSSVTFNAVCPGFVETEMSGAAIEKIQESTGRSEEEARAALAAFNPQRRLLQVDEVAHLTESLLADAARGINGQAIPLDGGQVMR